MGVDHRHGIHVCGGQPGNEVQRAGPGGGEHDAWLAAGAGVAVGHVRGPLLVPDQDVFELGMLGQVLVDGQVGAARVAEDVLDTLALQRLQDHVRSGQLGLQLLLKMKKPPPLGRGLLRSTLVSG